MTDAPTYVMDRTFDAPPALVWRGWTDAALLPRWYGPNVESIVHAIDVRPGGLWLHEMRMKGHSSFQKAEYRQVDAPDRLVFVQSTTDEHWNLVANPMMPDWPRHLMTTVTFAPADGGTQMRLTWAPHEATDAEIACFAGAMEGLGKGWAAGMELLAELLAQLQG